jgi:hypothetical protein
MRVKNLYSLYCPNREVIVHVRCRFAKLPQLCQTNHLLSTTPKPGTDTAVVCMYFPEPIQLHLSLESYLAGGRISKRLWSPGIDSEESIRPSLCSLLGRYDN